MGENASELLLLLLDPLVLELLPLLLLLLLRTVFDDIFIAKKLARVAIGVLPV